MRKFFFNLSFTLLSAILFYGCNNEEINGEGILPGKTTSLTLSEEIVNMQRDEESKVVYVSTELTDWTAQLLDVTSSSWLDVSVVKSQEDKKLIFYPKVNDNSKSRTAEIVVFSVDKTPLDTITVSQLGTAPDLLINVRPELLVASIQQSLPLEVTTNSPYEIIFNNSWISEDVNTRAMVTYYHNIKIEENTSTPRLGVVTIRTKEVTPAVEKTITITQKSPNGDIEVVQDILYRPTAARVSDFQSGAGASLAIDGDVSTFWHSQWSLDKPENFPKWLECDVPTEATTLDYLIVISRGGNGDWGDMELVYNTRETPGTWIKVGDYNFSYSGGGHPIFFKIPITNAKTFRFNIKNGSNGNATCREVEFYKYNTDDPLIRAIEKVFTSQACMELKEGVTNMDIAQLPEILQNVAVKLQEGTYPAEFRMGTYKAHSSPEKWATKLKSKKWGQADNPTGIWAEQGDTVIVMVGDTWGNKNIQLFSCDAFAGAHGDNYLLKTGVNEIVALKSGLFYVKYYVEDLHAADAKPVEVHFPEGSGYVNGYWDVEKHKTDAEYARIYKMSTQPFRMFDIVGKYTHLIYSRGYIPENAIVNAFKWYDNMCWWGWEIMGVDKLYNEGTINHRHVFVSNDQGYMDASDYRTHYHQNTLMERLQESTMKRTRDLMWGPAHEVGHQHQPVFNFHGYTEASNNFFSNLFVYKSNWGSKSRGPGIQTVINAGFANQAPINIGTDAAPIMVSFPQTPFVLMPRGPGADVFILQRTYWQLYTYYNIAGKNPDFWPAYFELLRKAPDLWSDPQANAMNNYILACRAAQEDLTDFFSAWGFFVPFAATIDDYGSKYHNLTQEMIDNAIAEVKAMNYPKAAPIEYIEDRDVMDQEDGHWTAGKGDTGYWQYYRDNARIKSNISVSKSGNTFTVTNWEGAAAFELKNNGVVKQKSVKKSFTVTDALLTPTAKLYAVQVDGARIQIWPAQ